MKINTKQICILFLSIFIGTNCAAKKTPKPSTANDNLTDSNKEIINEKNIVVDDSVTNKTINSLSARIQYLEELLNSYQAQSLALENPMSFFNKKVLLTNGSMLYGNITYQDDIIVQLETLIGSLAIEKNTIIRVVDQTASILDKDNQFIELNAENNIEEGIDNMQNQHSAEVVLLGDFKEEKDENQNTILSGQVKNIGLKRADFSKITFTIYRNQSYDSMPVEYTAFINGSSVSFDSNAISTSSLFTEEVGDFSLVIPSDFGPFVSYTYRIDWSEYE